MTILGLPTGIQHACDPPHALQVCFDLWPRHILLISHLPYNLGQVNKHRALCDTILFSCSLSIVDLLYVRIKARIVEIRPVLLAHLIDESKRCCSIAVVEGAKLERMLHQYRKPKLSSFGTANRPKVKFEV